MGRTVVYGTYCSLWDVLQFMGHTVVQFIGCTVVIGHTAVYRMYCSYRTYCSLWDILQFIGHTAVYRTYCSL